MNPRVAPLGPSLRLFPRRLVSWASLFPSAALGIACLLLPLTARAATNWVLIGWNNLGMHCMDSDFSVFSILPPYNTVQAQLVSSGGTTTRLLRSGSGFTVTYEAVADPSGSLNSHSRGKGSFWDYSTALFGVALAPDQGLPVPGPNSYFMPGTNNVPQAMAFEGTFNWFAAYGIPITPYDDAGKHNPYPLLRLVARDSAGTVLATARPVVPVSDEMDCKLCHASGSPEAAMPASGWQADPDQARDYRLNILRLHDDIRLGTMEFDNALTAAGCNPGGLHATVTLDQRPILCASCHLSEALPGSGQAGIKPLTEAIHTLHAYVADPRNGLMLNDAGNRAACYACHPGSVTRCLRGAMGKAVAEDGSMAMQCQSCHGPMTQVGSNTRTGWFDEPNCQACHTGDALSNGGQIRFTSAFDSPGHLRIPSDTRFATTPNTPAPRVSLYRFSAGHGGLQCSACHGSTHAEYPAAYTNDNLQSQDHQGHSGVLIECTTCHATMPTAVAGGPHGMHPVGNAWVSQHGGRLESSGGPGPCRACHGLDYRGAVLSRAQGERTLTSGFGTRSLWRGYQVGCYLCHNGPNSESPSPNARPTAANGSASVESGGSTTIGLQANDTNGNPLTARIISQPAHGVVALQGTNAIYHSDGGYAGADEFTFAAADGLADSNLGRVTVAVDVVDSDQDGLPDWYMIAEFGHRTGEAADRSRAGDDADGDGATNLEEYQANTDPRRANSVLRLARVSTSTSGATIRFNSVLGSRYQVFAASDLSPAVWSPVATNLWGRVDSTTATDPTVDQPRRFYRVEAVP